MSTPLIGPDSLQEAAGIGVDMVTISAFAEQLDEPGTRFRQAFTPGERRASRTPKDVGVSAKSGTPAGGTALQEAQSLAARWAAKEAVIKAWSSTCFGQPEVIDPIRVNLRDIEVRTDAWGRPSIRLHGDVARAMTGYNVLVSLSHDPAADVAVAFVVLQHSQEDQHV